MSKLPRGIRLQIARNTSEEVWKITDLLEVMRKEVEARELSEDVRSSEIDNRKSDTGNEIDNYRKINQIPSVCREFVCTGRSNKRSQNVCIVGSITFLHHVLGFKIKASERKF